MYGHAGFESYELWAEKTFNMIKYVMVENVNNHKFYLENELQSNIYDYISKINEKLKINKTYQSVLAKINLHNTDEKPKIGAIVMNCNPFTYGHEYLIDIASKLVDLLFVFVVGRE